MIRWTVVLLVLMATLLWPSIGLSETVCTPQGCFTARPIQNASAGLSRVLVRGVARCRDLRLIRRCR